MSEKKKYDDDVYDMALGMLQKDSKSPRVNEVTGVLTQDGKPPQSPYASKAAPMSLGEKKNAALDAYLNRGPFKYDINTDALYQQYKDKYIQQGQAAMQDTMGQAAALTGGYGSSYAQNVGQQAYNQHLQQLNDVVPELYQMAYSQYQDQGNEMLQRYALLSDEEREAYNRQYQLERDAVSDQQWQQSFDYQKARDKASDDKYSSEVEAEKSMERAYALAAVGDFSELAKQLNVSYGQAAAYYAVANGQGETISEEKAMAMALTGDYSGLMQLHGFTEAEANAYAAAKGYTQGSNEPNVVFSHTDLDTGLNHYYLDGKEVKCQAGVSPITGTTNADVKNGTMPNGYQPDNIGGTKVGDPVGYDAVNGKEVPVYQVDGQLYAWSESKNKYVKHDGYAGMDTENMQTFRKSYAKSEWKGYSDEDHAYLVKQAIDARLNSGALTSGEVAALMVEFGLV